MLKKKLNSSEKKRKHSQCEDREGNNKRRSNESKLEQDSKDELADPELDRIGSDIEDGGLDLSRPFQPITAYVTNKQEMLEQCFRVLGDKKLQKMLPDELKSCSLEEIKKLCWEQLEPISEKTISEILAGKEVAAANDDGITGETLERQQDNNLDSTSCPKGTAKTEDPKQEGGNLFEESDVLSINADAYDSDIEGPKEDQTAKSVNGAVKAAESSNAGVGPRVNSDPANPEPPIGCQPAKPKKDIQIDIDKSVSEILSFPLTSSRPVTEDVQSVPVQSISVSSPVQCAPALSHSPAVCQPSIQQLELLELEMRARAIKALMKASDGKKLCLTKNV